jgi:hypothetical protein
MGKKPVFLRIGGKYRIIYPQLQKAGEVNPNNKTIYIRGIVDDLIVYREWSRRKRNWAYQIEPLEFFAGLEHSGWIKDIGNG